MDMQKENPTAMRGEEFSLQHVNKNVLRGNDLPPRIRGRESSQFFLSATALGMQQENIAANGQEIWLAKEKGRVFDGMHKRRTSVIVGNNSSSSGVVPRDASTDCDASALCASYSGKDVSMTDSQIEDFLSSRIKRGRGTVGPRMNVEGCFTSASSFNVQTSKKREDGKCFLDKYGIMTDNETEDFVGSRVKHHRGSALSRLANKSCISPSFSEVRVSAFSRLGNKDSCKSPEAKRGSAFSRLGKKDPSISPSFPDAKRRQVLANVVDAWRLGTISSAGDRRNMKMEVDLSPRLARKVYGGDGGSYHAWCPTELAMLREGNIGAAKLALERNGFALPRYSDSAKVAYVLQGHGVAGIVLPEKEEKVIAIKKGDAIALPFGVVTWWYNKEDTELVVLLLGDTSKGHKAGEFTDFFLTGINGIFTGFSPEFVGRAWDLDDKSVATLVGSQSGKGIVKLPASFKMPEPKKEHRNGLVYNCEEAPLDVDIKNGGRVVVLNTKNLPLVAEVGLGADLVRLDGGAMCSPGFSCDSALQVTYIVRGSGRVQVVGVDGSRVLEATVKAGNLFIVPRFYVVSKICDADGMDWFSIITTPNPIFTHLAGRTSTWKALSPQVLQASFNVSPELEKHFSSKRTTSEIFFPPPN